MSREQVTVDDVSEAESLAVEMARAYHRMTTFYREQLQMSSAEADARARGLDSTPQEAAADLVRVRERAPDQVSWWDLNRHVERQPDETASIWRQLRAAAERELASGHRTAVALEWHGRPWERARFLALRDSFQGAGPPLDGIEAALIDSAAEAFSAYLQATEQVSMMTAIDMEHEQKRAEEFGKWRPQRLSYAEAVDRAARMAEQAHARFLRTVKMLHEIRRLSSAVYVGHAGQINIGNQQLNVATEARNGNDAALSPNDFDKR